MIELKNDALSFSFPEVHPQACAEVHFQRTLRIPDDGKKHRLPPGLGRFPLTHIDDHAERVPGEWLRRGGVMLPMYQSEALWVNFSPFGPYSEDRVDDGWIYSPYPFALKVAAGKINAVTGKAWSNGLTRKPQDYLVLPEQPWLDGFCVKKGVVRQFVAMPLGAGYTAEEQITGAAEHGGLQVIAYPMKPDVYLRRFPPRKRGIMVMEDVCFGGIHMDVMEVGSPRSAFSMGLAPGGRMKQKIYPDRFDFSDWDTEHSSRCFIHLANSMVWRSITGDDPPTTPPTAAEYTRAGLPWFDVYDEKQKTVKGSRILDGLKSVLEMGEEKGDVPLPENESVVPKRVIGLRPRQRKDQVREEAF